MTKIADIVLDIVRDNPALNNEQVAAEVQRRVPGSTTSAASVSSIKSKAKRNGVSMPDSTIDGFEAPTTDLPVDLPEETDEERSSRIRRRYNTLERMAYRVADGALPALIVSGPPGLGKSYTVEQVLQQSDMIDASVIPQEDMEVYEGERMYDVVSGSITAVGLYIALWNMRSKGSVLVLDDCDDVFRDETSLNLLKAVLDSSETRRVSYRKRAHWMDELEIPDSFEFKGSVVFCTNVDFEVAIAKGSLMGSHFSALIDRSLYLSLTMRTTEDFIVRIRHVAIEDGMLVKSGLTDEQANEVMDFVIDNQSRFYGLSIRLVHQIAICLRTDPENWKDDVEATKMRTF